LDEDIEIDYHNVNRYINEIFEKIDSRRIILLLPRNKLRRTQPVLKILSWRDVEYISTLA